MRTIVFLFFLDLLFLTFLAQDGNGRRREFLERVIHYSSNVRYTAFSKSSTTLVHVGRICIPSVDCLVNKYGYYVYASLYHVSFFRFSLLYCIAKSFLNIFLSLIHNFLSFLILQMEFDKELRTLHYKIKYIKNRIISIVKHDVR